LECGGLAPLSRVSPAKRRATQEARILPRRCGRCSGRRGKGKGLRSKDLSYMAAKEAALRIGGIHGCARKFGSRISAVSIRIIYLQLGRSGER
jgi:hypothetical protein